MILLVRPIQTLPGYYEKERLRLIRTAVDGEIIFESYVDLRLDHLPPPAYTSSIRAFKLIEKELKLYTVLMYEGGGVVVLDLTEIADETTVYSEFLNLLEELITTVFTIAIFGYLLFARPIFMRRQNN